MITTYTICFLSKIQIKNACLTQHIQLQTPAYHWDLVTRSLCEVQPLEFAVPLLLQYSQYLDYIDF